MSICSKIIDLTYLIDDAYSKEIPDGDYISKVPTGKLSYKIFRDKILADIRSTCTCKTNCIQQLLKQVDETTLVRKIEKLRAMYFSIVQGDKRTTKLLELVRSSRIWSKEHRRIMHNFEGVSVCRMKWKDIIGISKTTYQRAVAQVNADFYTLEKIPKQSSRSCKGFDAIGFLDMTLKFYGDYSPEIEKTLLPPCLTKKFLYEEYLLHPVEHVSEHHFYKLFNTTYGNNVLFSTHRNINPCDVCMLASNTLPTLTNETDRQNLKMDLKEHLNRQRNERIAYYAHKSDALARPQYALSLIVDGMDQAKTGIPHFRGWGKPKSALGALKTHITGVIIHGRQDKFFIDCNQYPHDTNLTVTCIVNAITDHISPEGHLPQTLYIQCDNCGRENKNKYILGFLAFMCQVGLVKEVYLSFLMKGHTHEDIDQRFSKISTKLRRDNAFTMPELHNLVKGSFTTQSHVEVLGTMWDVRSWICESINDIYNHSYPHQFWLFVDRPNHVALKTRLWSNDDWYPSSEDESLEILTLNGDGVQVLPRGQPIPVEPSFLKGFENMPEIIEKMKIHLNFEQYEWWKSFLDDPGRSFDHRPEWPLNRVRPVHKIIEMPVEIQSTDWTTIVTPLIDIERNRPKVQVKKRKQKN